MTTDKDESGNVARLTTGAEDDVDDDVSTTTRRGLKVPADAATAATSTSATRFNVDDDVAGGGRTASIGKRTPRNISCEREIWFQDIKKNDVAPVRSHDEISPSTPTTWLCRRSSSSPQHQCLASNTNPKVSAWFCVCLDKPRAITTTTDRCCANNTCAKQFRHQPAHQTPIFSEKKKENQTNGIRLHCDR